MRGETGRRRGDANPFRGYVKRPGQDESDWKSSQQQHNDQALRPIRQLPGRKDRRRNLNDAPGHDDVGNGDAINFPPLHLLEKAAHKNVVHCVASRLPLSDRQLCSRLVEAKRFQR
jgi:hypothetical protein